MRINITTSEILFNIKNKSHQELAVLLADPEQRYPQEAGDDKLEDIKRCVVEAAADAVGVVSRFEYGRLAEEEVTAGASESGILLPEFFTFDVENSERRIVTEEQALADLILSYITNRSLARYYYNAGRNDLAAKDDANAVNDKDLILKILYRKRRPAIPTRE